MKPARHSDYKGLELPHSNDVNRCFISHLYLHQLTEGVTYHLDGVELILLSLLLFHWTI